MGKNVLIIGASGDIGLAISEQLVREGYQLLVHYHKNIEPIKQLCLTYGREKVLQVVQANLMKMEDINKLLHEIEYPIHHIVFASGRAHYGLFQDVTNEELDDLLTLHVTAPLLITKEYLPAMLYNKCGNIIFITSIWGSIGASYEVVYSTVKGAQNSFVKALAKEVGPSGISVNAISPGYIDTKMNEHLSIEEKQSIIAEIPLRRAGLSKEIAHTTSFLLDERANYIHGEIIQVTGGW